MKMPDTLAAHPLGVALQAARDAMAQAAQDGLRTSALLGGEDETYALQLLREIRAYEDAVTHRIVAEGVDAGTPMQLGGPATTPGQWLRSALGITGTAGRALADTAELLDRHREPIAMLAAGEATLEHAKVLARALDEISKLPGVTREEYAKAADTLCADAVQVDPVGLTRVASAIVERLTRTPSVDDPADEPDLTDPLPDRWLRIDKHRDGTSDGRWRNLDPIATATLEALLADTHPKTGQPKTTTPAPSGSGIGTGSAFGLDGDTAADSDRDAVADAEDEALADRRTRGQRWLDTLAGVLRHAGDCDPTSPPAQSAVTLTVATEYDTLAKQLGEGRLDSDVPLDPGTVRRLACEAGILPVVMDGPSRILDLGRTQRLFTPAQRAALTLRDRGCTFPGCDQPAHRSIAHHRQHWEHGGATDLDNAALLCLHHHIRIHREKWESRLSPVNGHVEWRPPRLIDPDRRWRQHIRYRLDRLRT